MCNTLYCTVPLQCNGRLASLRRVFYVQLYILHVLSNLKKGGSVLLLHACNTGSCGIRPRPHGLTPAPHCHEVNRKFLYCLTIALLYEELRTSTSPTTVAACDDGVVVRRDCAGALSAVALPGDGAGVSLTNRGAISL
jgi:hypothetical protein